MALNLVLFTLAFTSALIVRTDSVQQEITFYETTVDPSAIDGSVRHFSFTRNQRHLDEALAAAGAGFMRAAGVCAKTGLWAVYAESNYAPFGNFHLLDAVSRPGPVCLNMTAAPVHSMRPVGSFVDMSVPSLSLFDHPNIEWGRQFDFAGTHLVLPFPMTFSSYGFTGTQTYTISPGTDVGPPWDQGMGRSQPPPSPQLFRQDTCLQLPRHNAGQTSQLVAANGGSLLTYRQDTKLVVKEIQAGCNGNEGQVLYPEYDITPFMQLRGNNTQTSAPSREDGPGLRLTVKDPNTGRVGVLSLTGSALRLTEPLLILDLEFTGSPPANWTYFPYVWGFDGATCIRPGAPSLFNASRPLPTGGFTLGC